MKFNYIISVHFSDGCIEEFNSLQEAKDAVNKYECRDGEEQTPVTVDCITAEPRIMLEANSFDSLESEIKEFESR